MSLNSWLARLQRIKRKAARARTRRNVRTYRQRKEEAGVRRLDVYLDSEAFAEARCYTATRRIL